VHDQKARRGGEEKGKAFSNNRPGCGGGKGGKGNCGGEKVKDFGRRGGKGEGGLGLKTLKPFFANERCKEEKKGKKKGV